MDTNRDERLEQAIGKVDQLIALARETGSQSAMFFEMAKLQLQLDYNGITDNPGNVFHEHLAGS